MLVGHLPFLTRLAALLVTGDPDRPVVQFRYSAVVCLEPMDQATTQDGRFLVAWIATPDMA